MRLSALLVLFILSIVPLIGSQNTYPSAPNADSFSLYLYQTTDTMAVNFDGDTGIGSSIFIDSSSIYRSRISFEKLQGVPYLVSRPESWIFILIMLQLFMIAVIRLSASKYLQDLLRALLNPTIAQQQFRDQEAGTPFPAFISNLNFSISISVYVFLLLYHSNVSYDFKPYNFFLILFALVSLVYIIRFLTLQFLRFVFPMGEDLGLYSFNFFINQKALGFALIPLNLLLAYGHPFVMRAALYFSFFLLFVLFLFRVWKGFTIGIKYLYSNTFHFFLYICTLEIIPVLVLAKLIVSAV